MDELQQILKFKPSPPIVGDDPRKSDKVREAVLRWNVCYIVCGLVIERDKILMIQEAKPSCRGKWYIPAGRVEQNESLEDAVRREVKEESGLDFQPHSLIAIELQGHSWLRFSFAGKIVGGKLKTPDQEDKESIQAQWLPADIKELCRGFNIRAGDCLELIELASAWYSENECYRYSHKIVPVSSKQITFRIILVYKESEGIQVLVRDKPAGQTWLPGSVLGHYPLVHHEVTASLKEAGYKDQYDIVGGLTVEHLVTAGDGIGFTLLIRALKASLKDGCGFHWEPIKDSEMLGRVQLALDHKYSTIKFFNL